MVVSILSITPNLFIQPWVTSYIFWWNFTNPCTKFEEQRQKTYAIFLRIHFGFRRMESFLKPFLYPKPGKTEIWNRFSLSGYDYFGFTVLAVPPLPLEIKKVATYLNTLIVWRKKFASSPGCDPGSCTGSEMCLVKITGQIPCFFY